jgi:hypothetical protein
MAETKKSEAKKEEARKEEYEWLKGELKPEHLPQIYELLSAPMDEVPKKRIQRSFTKDTVYEGQRYTGTGKGYDTIGYNMHDVLARLIRVIGLNHLEITETVDEYETGNDKQPWGATCRIEIRLGNMVEGKFVPVCPSFSNYGGSVNKSKGDALKGAYTNTFKKVAAMYGVGQAAFLEAIDEDIEAPGNKASTEGPKGGDKSGKDKSEKQGGTERSSGGNGNGKALEEMSLEQVQTKYFQLLDHYGLTHAHAEAYCRKIMNKSVEELDKPNLVGFATRIREKADRDIEKLEADMAEAHAKIAA